ncbi:hypothetical protein U9M48_035265 [Paspalum notatum var. saurae]|uniref:HAT C-terminal dimerisation domain-containing protein n=1 Tax=Paspalum notatum var. saurae TaxID=547442 RepID=A0AAQ3UEN8_PASNO
MKIQLFSLSLTGPAFGWYITLAPGSITTWKQLEEKFHAHFFSGSDEATMTDLTSRSAFDVFIETHYPARDEGPLLTNDHWYVDEKILEFLDKFYYSTVVMSGIYYPTSPLMLHHILSMLTHLNEYENDDLLRLTRKDYSAYLTTVRDDLFDLFKKYDDKFGGTDNSRIANAPGLGANHFGLGTGSSNPSLLSRRTVASALLHAASTNARVAGTKLSSYLDNDQKFDDDFDILDWWRDRKITYSVLSILAKNILSVSISTVSSESAFSLVSRVIEERRRRLGSGIVEMLSLIKDWEEADARMQHTAEDKAMLDAFEDLFLDGDLI